MHGRPGAASDRPDAVRHSDQMAVDRARPTTRAASSAETRAALLEAGALLLQERPVGNVLNQIKAPLVARRAGRTTGAFYHHWESQEAYHQDLLNYVLDPARIPSTSEAVTAIAVGLDAGVSVAELLRLAARANFDSVRADPYVPLWVALWARQGQDERIRHLLLEHYRTVTRQTTPLYEALFAAMGRRIRPPFTAETFAVTITALVQGLSLRVTIEPDAVPQDLLGLPGTATDQPHGAAGAGEGTHENTWDLFSAVAWTLLNSMSEPITAE
jgi:AcrR family transcriptional regulator